MQGVFFIVVIVGHGWKGVCDFFGAFREVELIAVIYCWFFELASRGSAVDLGVVIRVISHLFCLYPSILYTFVKILL